jgi:dTDP-4-amino-4,6-dideoxygalactose transaminase
MLADVPGLKLQAEPAWARSNWQSYCVRLPNSCDQQQVMQAMLDAGIATRRGIMCAHTEPAYSSEAWSCGIAREACNCSEGRCDRLRESEQAQDRAIVLPLFHQMTEQEQDRVVEVLKSVCQV